MREQDIERFYAVFDAVQGLYPNAKAATVAQREVWFRALVAYPLSEIRAAFDAHVKDPQRGRFAPMPADIIAQLEGAAADDGRPGAEEAWSIAVRAEEEAATVVWTEEIAEAWGIAHPVAHAGDKVGARMAFREAYERLVDEARHARRPAAWSPSLGSDAAARDRAIAEAVERGLLSRNAHPALAGPAVAANLLEWGAQAHAPAGVREGLERVKARMTGTVDVSDAERGIRAWAVRLKAREEAGEPLTQVQRQCWREALYGAPSAGPVGSGFRAPPPDCLPPGMRPRPDPEAEYAAHGVQP